MTKNAKDLDTSDIQSFLLVGPPGSGKTTQFRTIPGRGFIYIFDPNALASLTRLDVDYEVFSPDLLDINVTPLSKKRAGDTVTRVREPRTYIKFEEHIDDFLEGPIKKYDWIGFDSFTTFSDAVMDRVLWLNKRTGKHPEQADWTAQMTTIQNVMRSLVHRGKMIVATAHEEVIQDRIVQTYAFQPLLTGRLKIRIPLLFSNIYRTEADTIEDKAHYYLWTTPDRKHNYIRSAIKGLPSILEVTITDFKRQQSFGIGAILSGSVRAEKEISSKKSSGKRTRRF